MSMYQESDYKSLYRGMKRKLKILIYENECFQEELRKAQRSLLKVQKDKSFLLDRILQYQQGPESSSDSEQTDESDNDNYTKDSKRRKVTTDQNSTFALTVQNNAKTSNIKKKKGNLNVLGGGIVVTKNSNISRQTSKQNPSVGSTHVSSGKGSSHHKWKSQLQSNQASSNSGLSLSTLSAPTTTTSTALAGVNDGQMTREEIERQLAARQPISDFSTTVSLTLPNQLFSDNLNEGDLLENEMETSPSNIGEDINFESFD